MLADEIETLRVELRAFRREHTSFRERAHAAVDATIVEANEFARQLLDSIATSQGSVSVRLSPGSSEPAPRAAGLLALTQPAFSKAWHEAVDRADGFSELTVAEFEKRAAKLEAEIRAREVELERRRILAAREEADQELASLERRL